MTQRLTKSAKKQLKLPLFGVGAAIALALPSAGLAVVGLAGVSNTETSIELFTPASVDPELAARVAEKARERGIPFTPAGTGLVSTDRTVTVAVRIDDETAQAISVRPALDAEPGKGPGIAGLQSSRFNLGTARGYSSFARVQVETPPASGISLPENVRGTQLSNLSIPDLSEFEPAGASREDEPSRLQPRIALEDNSIAGRSVNTLDASEDSVDVGGSFRVSRNLDVTAGVRYSQERDRLAPLTDASQDSQAVYVGTQIRF